MSICVPTVAFPCAQLIRAQGTRYDFEILARPVESQWAFELRAFDRASGCRSVINAVNVVIGQLLPDEQDATDPGWPETPWMVFNGRMRAPVPSCVRPAQ